MAKVAVFMADGLEECEALLVVDLLRRAGIDVTTVSVMESRRIVSSHNVAIETDVLFDDEDFSNYDILFLPGGIPGTNHLEEHKGLVELLKDFNSKNKIISAICAAPSIFAKLGFLKGKDAVCYPSFKDVLTENGANYIDTEYVKTGNIITGQGLGADFAFAAALISELKGEDAAKAVLNQICYRH